jgi:hypothetical protein
MSSTTDGFFGRSLTVFCGTGSLRKFRALILRYTYVIVHVCKLQSEMCGAYSYDATAGMGCVCSEGTERKWKWMFPYWGRRQLFSLKNWPICKIRQSNFHEYSNLLYAYPEPFPNTYFWRKNLPPPSTYCHVSEDIPQLCCRSLLMACRRYSQWYIAYWSSITIDWFFGSS